MKRYEPTKFNFSPPHFDFEETPEGPWVRFDDVAPLIEALRDIEARSGDPVIEHVARAALEKAAVKP